MRSIMALPVTPGRFLPSGSFQTVLDRFSETGSTLDLEEIRRAAANVRKRAAACTECGGGHFEHLLKRLKMKLPRNRIKTVDNCKVMT